MPAQNSQLDGLFPAPFSPSHTRSMHITLDKNVHSTYAVQLDLFAGVVAPVSHLGQVLAPCLELLIAFSENSILRETRG